MCGLVHPDQHAVRHTSKKTSMKLVFWKPCGRPRLGRSAHFMGETLASALTAEAWPMFAALAAFFSGLSTSFFSALAFAVAFTSAFASAFASALTSLVSTLAGAANAAGFVATTGATAGAWANAPTAKKPATRVARSLFMKDFLGSGFQSNTLLNLNLQRAPMAG